jgi:hypothetical protein
MKYSEITSTHNKQIDEAGQNAERQENGFVQAIAESIAQNDGNPITLDTGHATVKGVTGATKFTGRQASGSEPYTDVVLQTTNGPLNLSMKGPTAPSLAGGGLRGISEIIPDIGSNFFKAAHKNLIAKGYKEGDKLPDTFGKLNDKDKMLLVVGTTAMGGPIDYMYIGPMDVDHSAESGIVKINGSLIAASDYANSKDLFFRLRARRIDQTFDPKAAYTGGIPKIYGKSPSRGDSAGRLVIVDRVSGRGELVVF